MSEVELKSIEGVEIFSEGLWNGKEVKGEDIDNIIRSFEDSGWRPRLKIGHNDEQGFLQADGFPAAGKIARLYKKGKKLVADFVDIPKKIYDLIKNKVYENVSCEVWTDFRFNKEKTYPKFLSAVSLLGTEMPAVTNLDSIHALFSASELFTVEDTDLNKEIFNISFREEEMTDETKKELEVKDAELNAVKDEFAAAKTELTNAKLRLAEIEAEKIKLARNAWLDKLEMEKKSGPGMRGLLSELLDDTGKAEFSVGEKKYNKTELIESILELKTEVDKVNFTESSSNEPPVETKKDEVAEFEVSVKEVMERDGLGYMDAAKTVLNEQPKK